MLFYDQNNALGQFQGFNNVTHEYRINNIAKTAAAVNGSINFMTGGISRFFVAATATSASAPRRRRRCLEVSNAIARRLSRPTTYSAVSPERSVALITGEESRGTPAAPTAVQSGDGLSALRRGLRRDDIWAPRPEPITSRPRKTGQTRPRAPRSTFIDHGKQFDDPGDPDDVSTRQGTSASGPSSPQANLEVSNALRARIARECHR